MRLARVLGIHRNTLKKKLDKLGIHFKYSSIEKSDLDALVKAYKVKKPGVGFRYVHGHLRSLGLRIQRQRVLDTLRRVDRVGRLIRKRTVIRRRKYFSSRPNALWHCDGHHKLIKYGFVIHGFIDGNCRTVRHSVSLMTEFRSLVIPNLRSQCFVQIQITSQAQSLSYFCWPLGYMALRLGFVGIVAGKMSWSPHI